MRDSRGRSKDVRGRGGIGTERAFLVGIDYRHRNRPNRSSPKCDREAAGDGSAGRTISAVPPSARMARDSAALRKQELEEHAIAFDADESLSELRELTASAGAEIVGQVLQNRDRPDPATLIGKGKLDEIAGAAKMSEADVVIFDHDLSPSQLRNLEREIDCRVLDRTQLILDIFARHARTREGQLQVELAQLEYLLPRLAGRGVDMSQLGGGIGTRGPGETQLETDRRKIYRRIRHVKEQLEDVRRIRSQQRRRRESAPVATVALVGYTNAGKSTLFNALTKAGVLESARMFATLDPTLRAVHLPSKRQVLLSDTVGFIRNLPHTLVSAFRATLEEVQKASLLLHVTDATSPVAYEQMAQVEAVLRELEVGSKQRIHVMNKIDLLAKDKRESLIDDDATVHVSAVRGMGLNELLAAIDRALQEDPVRHVQLRVPVADGKALSILDSKARVRSRDYRDETVEMDVQAPESVLRRVAQYITWREP
jgi:GTP-binding protein HflX